LAQAENQLYQACFILAHLGHVAMSDLSPRGSTDPKKPK
jgi:hypothetical protein